jgi:hypothetical protein
MMLQNEWLTKPHKKRRCIQCARAPRHGRWRRCRACMIPIWRAATIKAWHSRKLMRAAQTPELQQRKAA